MAFVSIPTGLDDALLARAGLSTQALTRLQASGIKLSVEKLDTAMVEHGLEVHERIAVKDMLRNRGLL